MVVYHQSKEVLGDSAAWLCRLFGGGGWQSYQQLGGLPYLLGSWYIYLPWNCGQLLFPCIYAV